MYTEMQVFIRMSHSNFFWNVGNYAFVLLGGDASSVLLRGDASSVLLGGDASSVLLGGDASSVLLGGDASSMLLEITLLTHFTAQYRPKLK